MKKSLPITIFLIGVISFASTLMYISQTRPTESTKSENTKFEIDFEWGDCESKYKRNIVHISDAGEATLIELSEDGKRSSEKTIILSHETLSNISRTLTENNFFDLDNLLTSPEGVVITSGGCSMLSYNSDSISKKIIENSSLSIEYTKIKSILIQAISQ